MSSRNADPVGFSTLDRVTKPSTTPWRGPHYASLGVTFCAKKKCPIRRRTCGRWGTLGQVNSTLQRDPELIVPDDLSFLRGRVLLPEQARRIAQGNDVRRSCHFPERPYAVSLHVGGSFHDVLPISHPLLSGVPGVALKFVDHRLGAYAARNCTAALPERQTCETKDAQNTQYNFHRICLRPRRIQDQGVGDGP